MAATKRGKGAKRRRTSEERAEDRDLAEQAVEVITGRLLDRDEGDPPQYGSIEYALNQCAKVLRRHHIELVTLNITTGEAAITYGSHHVLHLGDD